ncbi:MAG: TetR family transcriptional regulator [Draconibacterium sp.]|nr:MAG: TetR family transcriptional regulator [Draconibacterium sp.]PIF05092.1 MAG: TetR family transcriptional regulator [Draconibacterium sp.]
MGVQKKDSTEEKILIAAQNVFTRKGMDGARMQSIADEAGINKALLHYYFRTKEKLFNAIFTKVFKRIYPNLMAMVNTEAPIETKIEKFVDTYINMLQDNPYLPSFLLKEMNRNANFIANIIHEHGVKLNEVFSMLTKEMDEGNIRKMDPREILINLLSLCIFPIATKPLITTMFFENDKVAYKQFIEDRKKTVTEFIINSIVIK